MASNITSNISWINVDSSEKIEEIKELSGRERVLLLFYSSESPVDYIVRSLLEREWHDDALRMKAYIVSDTGMAAKAASEFSSENVSPQVLIIEKGKPVFTAINGKALVSAIKPFAN